jgi:formylglycine-generating enzyme required for sulfatase activity
MASDIISIPISRRLTVLVIAAALSVCVPMMERQALAQTEVTERTYTNSIGTEFVRISAGKFVMGSPDGSVSSRATGTWVADRGGGR